MAIHKQWKGIFLSILSATALSLVYIFSKAALNEINFWQFAFYWFLLAAVENGIFFFAAGLYKKFLNLSAKEKRLIIIISLFELIGTISFFAAIELYKNPTVVSFLANVVPIMVGILSYLFLKERFNFWEVVGIVITIIGAMIIGYQSTVLKEVEKIGLGLLLVFLFVMAFSVNSVLARVSLKTSHPVMITFFRSVFLFVFAAVMVGLKDTSLAVPWTALKNIILGASFGPFIGVLAAFWALKYVEATISSVIINAKGFLIMVLVYWYLSIPPATYQIYGGLLAVLGVGILSYGKHLKIKMLSINA